MTYPQILRYFLAMVYCVLYRHRWCNFNFRGACLQFTRVKIEGQFC